MAAANPDLRTPVPFCGTSKHPQIDRKDCEACRAYNRHRGTIRRDLLAAGLAEKKPAQPRPWKRKPELLTPVTRCKVHNGHHGGNYSTCEACRARDRYNGARNRAERRAGVDNRRRPIETAQAHVHRLIAEGGHTNLTIADISGLTSETISRVRVGGRGMQRTKTIDYLTHTAIMAVQPIGVGPALPTGYVDPLEARRIVQGLGAQGWSREHIAQLAGYSSKSGVSHPLFSTTRYIRIELLEKLRRVADKLRDQDITETQKPYPPGMQTRCYNDAMRRGWVPLRDWDGLDLADPNAKPEPEPDDAGPFVDYPALHLRVAEAAERDYVHPLTAITRLELYVVVALARDAGMSASATGALLGYPQHTGEERKTGERQSSRLRAHLADARLWLDTEPDGDPPTWLTTDGKGRKANFNKRYLPALVAVQPEPFGRGMTPAQLAERCGADVTPEQVAAFLKRAAVLADRPWSPLADQPVEKSRVRRRTARTGRRAGEERRAA